MRDTPLRIRRMREFAPHDKFTHHGCRGKRLSVRFNRPRCTQITVAARGDFRAHPEQATPEQFSTKVRRRHFHTPRGQGVQRRHRPNNENAFRIDANLGG